MIDNPLHVMTVLIITGMLMLGIGYTLREREAGVVLLTLGVVVMLSSLLYRVYLAIA